MLELLFPKSCAGCGAAGVSLCASCQEELRRVPHRVSCTVDPRVPVWALSPYAGAHRQLVISMKERGRRDACAYVGAAVRAAVDFLAARGELPFAVDLTLVPAPTRARSARLRRCVRPQAYRRSRACNTAVQCGILWGLMLLRGVETWRKVWTCFKCRPRRCCWWTML